ncbi:MAG: ACT domain-containing protein [Candidatus Micrarchaeota archaeon]
MKQITVIVDDEVGKLADISFILGKSKINIDSISVGNVGGKGIINLTVKNEGKAISVLSANGYQCLKSNVIVTKLPNKPGELAKMTKLLSDNKVNIDTVSVITQDERYSIYSLKVDKISKAEKILKPYMDIED